MGGSALLSAPEAFGSTRRTASAASGSQGLHQVGLPPPGVVPVQAATGRRHIARAKRPATKAASVRLAFPAGLRPVTWKSLKAALWLTKMLPVRLTDRF